MADELNKDSKKIIDHHIKIILAIREYLAKNYSETMGIDFGMGTAIAIYSNVREYIRLIENENDMIR